MNSIVLAAVNDTGIAYTSRISSQLSARLIAVTPREPWWASSLRSSAHVTGIGSYKDACVMARDLSTTSSISCRVRSACIMSCTDILLWWPCPQLGDLVEIHHDGGAKHLEASHKRRQPLVLERGETELAVVSCATCPQLAVICHGSRVVFSTDNCHC